MRGSSWPDGLVRAGRGWAGDTRAAASLARYGTMRPAIESPTLDRFPMTQLPGWPAPLPVVYLIWIAVVLALYPICGWYAERKRHSDNPWLSYL